MLYLFICLVAGFSVLITYNMIMKDLTEMRELEERVYV